MLAVTTNTGKICSVVNVTIEGQLYDDDHRALRSIGHYAMAFREACWKSPHNPAAIEEPYVPRVGARSIVCRVGQEQQVAAVVQHIISGKSGLLPEVAA